MKQQYCYRNLKSGLWQVNDKPKSSSSAVKYERVAMRNVTFRVSSAVHVWVIKHGTRQVHAYAVGEVIPADMIPAGRPRVQISYSPMKCATFYRKDTGAAITRCEYVLFDAAGAFAIGDIE